VGFFMRNVTNEIHAMSVSSFLPNGLYTVGAVYSEPRMWGVELRYRFGHEK
jgi:hypothetical protein